ncbi:MAG: hypothetical protein ABMB14_19865 [Myxococcota bacterium]
MSVGARGAFFVGALAVGGVSFGAPGSMDPTLDHPDGWPLRFLGCRGPDGISAVGGLFLTEWTDQPSVWTVSLDDGPLTLYTRPAMRGAVGEGTGFVTLEGYAPVAVAWEAGRGGIARCRPDTLALTPATTVLSGIVDSPAPGGGPIEVVGCTGRARVAHPGDRFTMAVAAAGPCRVWARDLSIDTGAAAPGPGRDATLDWGAPIVVTPVPGAPVELRLSATPRLVDERWWAEVRVIPSGLEVVSTRGPARITEVGDRIVAIDGISLRDAPFATVNRQLADRTAPHVVTVIRGGTRIDLPFPAAVAAPVSEIQ